MRGILESAMDAIITVDDAQHVVLFNAAAEAMFGCPRREAIGAPLAWFIPERFRGAHAEHVRHFGETGTVSRRMGALRIVTGLRRNGEEFPIDASISQLDGVRRQVLHGDPARRLRAGPRRGGAAAVQGGAARARRGGERRAGAGEEPDRPRASRRAGAIADRAADGRRVVQGEDPRRPVGDGRETRQDGSACWTKPSRRRGGSLRICVR